MPRIGNTVPIKRNGDCSRVYHRATMKAHPLPVTFLRRNQLRQNRRRVPTSKKIGGAVQRNRAKRVIRAAYAAVEPEVMPGWDIVIVARTRTTTVKSTELAPVIRAQLKTLGILRDPSGAKDASGKSEP